MSTAVDVSAIARVVGIKPQFVDLRAGNIQLLPQRIALLGQGSTANVGSFPLTKQRLTSAAQAADIYGAGSPIHLAALQLLPPNGDGVGTIPVTVYPLADGTTESDGDITPSGAAGANNSYRVKVNEILSNEIVVASGDSVAAIVTKIVTAINAVLEMPIIAVDNTTEVTFTSKWKGASANDIFIEVDGPTDDITFAITQAANGAGNPDVDAATALFGDVWETMVLNCLNIGDTTTLDKFETFGLGRWGALTKKPLIVFTGTTESDVNTAITIPENRKNDYINSQLVLPGSNELPFVVAARTLSRIAVVANNNPARDYASKPLTGLEPGADGDQWNYLERDIAVKGGSSTIEVKDGVAEISDTVTFYHPTNEEPPAYRYVVQIVKLMNIIYNLNLIFATDEWNGAPLIPDGQPTTNREAKSPSMAKADIARMIDELALKALLSDPETAKAATTAVINDQNPNRLDITMTVQLSGNVSIISIDLNFGFFFGTQPIVNNV